MSANNTLEILDIDRPLLTTKQEEDMDHLGNFSLAIIEFLVTVFIVILKVIVILF